MSDNEIERITLVSAILAILFGVLRTFDTEGLEILTPEFLLIIFSEATVPFLGSLFLLYLVFLGMEKSTMDRLNWARPKQISYNLGILISFFTVIFIFLVQLLISAIELSPDFIYKTEVFTGIFFIFSMFLFFLTAVLGTQIYQK